MRSPQSRPHVDASKPAKGLVEIVNILLCRGGVDDVLQDSEIKRKVWSKKILR